MQGTMLWFNLDKGHGFIQTEDDERLYVGSEAFQPDQVPGPRCKGLAVAFDREDEAGAARAVNVAFVVAEEPRRARPRSPRGGRSL